MNGEIQFRYYRLRPDGRGTKQIQAEIDAARVARAEAEALLPRGATMFTQRRRLSAAGLPAGTTPADSGWRPTWQRVDGLTLWRPDRRTKAGRELAARIAALPPVRANPWAAFAPEHGHGRDIEVPYPGGIRVLSPDARLLGALWYVRVPQPGAMAPLDADEIKASEWYAALEAEAEAASKAPEASKGAGT